MPPFDWLSDQQRYTWDKAPRYDGRAVQVGPVARVLLAHAQDEPSVVALLGICMGRPEIRLEQMNPTAGLTLVRAEARRITRRGFRAWAIPRDAGEGWRLLGLMWLITLFLPVRIYLVIRADGYARAGSLSAMRSGGRWVRKGARFEDA